MTTRSYEAEVPIVEDCDNEHLFGVAAIECIDDRATPRPGTPVQRCDQCISATAGLDHFWSDDDAAEAVAAKARGRHIEREDDELGVLQAWIVPALDDCFGIHNFIALDGWGGDDPEDGPAFCTECGRQRVDPQPIH